MKKILLLTVVLFWGSNSFAQIPQFGLFGYYNPPSARIVITPDDTNKFPLYYLGAGDATFVLHGDLTWQPASGSDALPDTIGSSGPLVLQGGVFQWNGYVNLAWGVINADSTIASSSDNFTITHPSAGVYVITLDATPTDATCTATISGTTFGFITSSVSGAAITIRTDATGVSAADRAFNFIVTGAP